MKPGIILERATGLAAACLILAASCAPRAQPVGMPPIDFPVEALNEQVRLAAPAGWNSFEVNSPVGLVVEVVGPEAVIFPPDYGIRAFRYDGEEWVEVEQVPTTYAHGDVIVPPSGGDPLVTGATEIFPILPDTDKPLLLRIFVFGRVYREGEATDEEVGAYLDVVLKP